MKMQMSWMMRGAKDRAPMRYLREKLRRMRIDDFEVVLKEKDGDNAWVYLLRAEDGRYVLAKVWIYENEFDILCADVGVVVLDSAFAKKVAKKILEKQRRLVEVGE